MNAKVEKPVTLIDRIEQFCKKSNLYATRCGDELDVEAIAEKGTERMQILHSFQEQTPGMLRIHSTLVRVVPASKLPALAMLLRTVHPFDIGSLSHTPDEPVTHTVTTPMTVKQATHSRLDKLYLDIMVSLDPIMDLLAESA